MSIAQSRLRIFLSVIKFLLCTKCLHFLCLLYFCARNVCTFYVYFIFVHEMSALFVSTLFLCTYVKSVINFRCPSSKDYVMSVIKFRCPSSIDYGPFFTPLSLGSSTERAEGWRSQPFSEYL